MSQLFAWGGQSIGVLASASVLPMNTQDWSPLGRTGWMSLQSKGLSRVFSNTTVQKHQFFHTHLSLHLAARWPVKQVFGICHTWQIVINKWTQIWSCNWFAISFTSSLKAQLKEHLVGKVGKSEMRRYSRIGVSYSVSSGDTILWKQSDTRLHSEVALKLRAFWKA